MSNHPQHPLYVVSKGRSQYLMTSCALSAMGIQHFIVVELNRTGFRGGLLA